jgi:hypothetical protein
MGSGIIAASIWNVFWMATSSSTMSRAVDWMMAQLWDLLFRNNHENVKQYTTSSYPEAIFFFQLIKYNFVGNAPSVVLSRKCQYKLVE